MMEIIVQWMVVMRQLGVPQSLLTVTTEMNVPLTNVTPCVVAATNWLIVTTKTIVPLTVAIIPLDVNIQHSHAMMIMIVPLILVMSLPDVTTL
jgi:hypothetical protein